MNPRYNYYQLRSLRNRGVGESGEEKPGKREFQAGEWLSCVKCCRARALKIKTKRCPLSLALGWMKRKDWEHQVRIILSRGLADKGIADGGDTGWKDFYFYQNETEVLLWLQMQQGIREEQRIVKRGTGEKVGVELNKGHIICWDRWNILRTAVVAFQFRVSLIFAKQTNPNCGATLKRRKEGQEQNLGECQHLMQARVDSRPDHPGWIFSLGLAFPTIVRLWIPS